MVKRKLFAKTQFAENEKLKPEKLLKVILFHQNVLC